jgi:hypothetical protein
VKLALALLATLSVSELALAEASRSANDLPVHVVADTNAPVVTHANALASERFWPYQVALTQDWAAPSGKQLGAGLTGVLIRLDSAGNARVDFGRDGLHTLPLGFTDFLARANAVRTGAATKVAPNFTYAIAPRLVDAQRETPRRLPFDESFEIAAYLAVFSSGDSREIASLAKSLTPLVASQSRVKLTLFAQAERPDPELHTELRKAGWPGAFLMDHLAEAYARTLVDDLAATPQLALYSAEGRELWRSDASARSLAGLRAALEALGS